MPRGLTTVGAAMHAGSLYLVGGYFGSPHEYSKEYQSGSVARLNLDTGVWEELAGVEPIQSPAVVSDGRYLYKLGGLKALNAQDASTDLRSVTDNARFDANTNRWEPLPSFPEPRSSHQAVIVGETLYVVGGWQLHGGLNDNTWHSTMLTADFEPADARMERVNQCRFRCAHKGSPRTPASSTRSEGSLPTARPTRCTAMI